MFAPFGSLLRIFAALAGPFWDAEGSNLDPFGCADKEGSSLDPFG